MPMDPYIVKPQPTIKGYSGWAFSRVIEVLGLTQAEGAAHLITLWLNENRDLLDREFHISVGRYLEQKERDELQAEALQKGAKSGEVETELWAEAYRKGFRDGSQENRN